MALVRMSLEETMLRPTSIDRVKMNAITENQLAQMIAEDPDLAPDMSEEMMLHPRVIRNQLKMTQEAFADLINIPVATLRNWEQARTRPDPAARSLMVVMAYNLDGAVKALRAHKAA
jgi:putative transcriptional regulator